jgi:hypothetical protein
MGGNMAAIDSFSSNAEGLISPPDNAFAITPSDSSELPYVTRGIYTGAGGSLVVILNGDSSSVTFANLPAGVILPIRAKKVLATGTTSSMGLIGLY